MVFKKKPKTKAKLPAMPEVQAEELLDDEEEVEEEVETYEPEEEEIEGEEEPEEERPPVPAVKPVAKKNVVPPITREEVLDMAEGNFQRGLELLRIARTTR